MRCLQNELRHTVVSKRFLLSVLGMTGLSLLSISNEMEIGTSVSVYYLFTVYFFYPFWMLFLIFSAVPGATGFCIDWNCQIYRLKVARSGKKAYIFSKLMACIVSSFLVVVISQFLLLFILSLHRPMLLDGEAQRLLGGIYKGVANPKSIWIYFVIRTVMQALSACFFSTVALWISVKVLDGLVVITTPIILYYLAANLVSGLGIPFYLSIPRMVKGDIELSGGITLTLVYVTLILGVLTAWFGFLFFRTSKRRIENG